METIDELYEESQALLKNYRERERGKITNG